MVARYGRNLACEIVKEHFGESVEKVCRQLMQTGPQTLPDLGRALHLPPSLLKSCLLVLLNHNCLQPFRPEDNETSRGVWGLRTRTVYMVLPESILQRLRFPKFLLHTNETLGAEGERVLEGLLEHGRLTLHQMMERAAARADAGEHEVGRALAGLVRGRFVERCPLAEPLLPPRLLLEKTKRALRGGTRQRHVVVETGYFEAEEERIVALAQAPDSERFRLPPSVLDAAEGDEGNNKKRKRGVGVLSTGEEQKVLWRVNPEEFLRSFRHEVCVALITDRSDESAADVARGLLRFSRPQEQSLRQKESASVSADSVRQALRGAAEGWATDKVRGVLQGLAADQGGMVTRSSDAPGGMLFSIQLKKIIDTVRQKEVEAIVAQRYGLPACRIFRLLLLKKHLDQQQVADMALVPLKDARELLYRLLREGIVCVQGCSKTADLAPSRTFYLWKVQLGAVMGLLQDQLCHAASNLRQRLEHELKQEEELLLMLEKRQGEGGEGGGGHSVVLTAAQRGRLERIQKVGAVLEASLLRLDDSIMLFSCF